MRIHYHEFESLEHLLSNRLLPGGEHQPIRFVVFGGTGAVGGSSVMELCRLILMSKSLGPRSLRGEIYATGLGTKEISKFVSRMYLALGDDVEIDKIEPLRHYRLDGRIDLRFDILKLSIPADLEQHVEARRRAGEGDLEKVLGDYFAQQECPFLRYIEQLDVDFLHAALVAIPLPSVATYTLTSIDQLVESADLAHGKVQRVKKGYLKTFVRGLAVILQRHAHHVVMAHTTAVGGMYRVDGGQAEIRLGFAHSALGKKLVDKKYFADELTQLFIDQGFDVLVTAAAIGIDAVEFHCRLPSDRAVIGTLRDALSQPGAPAALPAEDLDQGCILLYPTRCVPLREDEGQTTDEQPEGEALAEDDALHFGAGKELIVDAAIRSGENGLFSVANCTALYHVMKVAIPEELAMVLVRRAVFGPERRRDWFENKVCHYSETENAYFALRLLESYPRLQRSHHGPFAIQAYQALGSSTHQARLHEIGLVMLLLRLHQLRQVFEQISEAELEKALPDIDDFVWRRTRTPAFEDLDDLDVETFASELATLCTVVSMEQAGHLLGYDARSHGARQPGREKFLSRLATAIGRYRQIITSLGIPILFRGDDGRDVVLTGPYLAPLEQAVLRRGDLAKQWHAEAERYDTTVELIRDGIVANNGFVDLRPHAIGNAAKEAGPQLVDHVRVMTNAEQLEDWLANLPTGSYFTTCGTLALLYRLRRLGDRVRRRKLRLGTRETWKHLFSEDADGRHLLSPGLIETARMYSEGQGKITGTEALWPPWGY